jgi:hypothetical protein
MKKNTDLDVNYNNFSYEFKGLYNSKGERLYCVLPFRMLVLGTTGIKPCTWLCEQVNKTIVEPHHGLVNAWTSEIYNDVQNSIRDGSYRHCRTIICPEINGYPRNLYTLEELKDLYPLIYDFVVNDRTEYAGSPDFVNLQFDTICNQACPSCNIQAIPKLSADLQQNYIQELKKNGNEIEYLFCAGIGDPFVSPSYKKILNNLNEKDFPKLKSIILQTNAMLWDEEHWNGLTSFTRDRIDTAIISIDGATNETYHLNRPGGNFNHLLKNLQFIKTLRINGPLKHLELNFVYQTNNFKEMPLLVKIAKDCGVDKLVFSKIANWGTYDKTYFKEIAVWDTEHPEYASLIKVFEQTEMQDPIVSIVR